jgi:hypothetical protein
MKKLMLLVFAIVLVSCGTGVKDVADQIPKDKLSAAGDGTEKGSDRCSKELTRLSKDYIAKKNPAAAENATIQQAMEAIKKNECDKGKLNEDCLEKMPSISKPEDIYKCKKK